MEVDPARMCELMVGLPAINVLGIDDERDGSVVVHVESCARRPGSPCCGTPAWVKDRPAVELVDLACFGRAARLMWHKHRWHCPAGDCEMGSWTGEDPRIAPTRGAMTDRADRCVCEQVGPFHLVKLANSKLDECRRQVQNETLGHRGRKDDALYRARRLLTKAHERLDERGETKPLGLLDAGDPRGQVRMAWHAKEVVRSIYEISDPELAGAFVDQIGVDLPRPPTTPTSTP